MRNGKLTTIIFIRDRNSKKQEISGYIDFAQRQGLTFVHFTAQREPILSLKHSNHPAYPMKSAYVEPNRGRVSAPAQRLKTDNMEPIFDRKRRLLPKPSDLSFFNWAER